MNLSIMWLIAGMTAVTFLPRVLPMAFFTRWAPPAKIGRLLRYIPAAIIAAILFPMLFYARDGNIAADPHVLLAALPVTVFSFKTRNLWAAVILGMLVYWLLGFCLH